MLVQLQWGHNGRNEHEGGLLKNEIVDFLKDLTDDHANLSRQCKGWNEEEAL